MATTETEAAVRERPIIFSSEMVKALLAGTKTQTRRVVNPQPQKWVDTYVRSASPDHWLPQGVILSDPSGVLGKGKVSARGNDTPVRCPHGAVGDRIWVREAWQVRGLMFGAKPSQTRAASRDAFHYRATDDGKWKEYWGAWRSPIHMPRWASRITLEVMGVRVERLQDISGDDAVAEGVSIDPADYSATIDGRPATVHAINPIYAYSVLWNKINGAGSWTANPWVWVIEFKRAL